MHLNRDWAMQECSGEGRASQQGLGDAGMLGRGQCISTRPCENRVEPRGGLGEAC